jgi:hypothetical protein
MFRKRIKRRHHEPVSKDHTKYYHFVDKETIWLLTLSTLSYNSVGSGNLRDR